jgi:hypothetical protein
MTDERAPESDVGFYDGAIGISKRRVKVELGWFWVLLLSIVGLGTWGACHELDAGEPSPRTEAT